MGSYLEKPFLLTLLCNVGACSACIVPGNEDLPKEEKPGVSSLFHNFCTSKIEHLGL